MIENAQKSASYEVKIENEIIEENSTKMTELEERSFKTTDNKIIFNNVCNQNLTSGKFSIDIFCINTDVALFKVLLYFKHYYKSYLQFFIFKQEDLFVQ